VIIVNKVSSSREQQSSNPRSVPPYTTQQGNITQHNKEILYNTTRKYYTTQQRNIIQHNKEILYNTTRKYYTT